MPDDTRREKRNRKAGPIADPVDRRRVDSLEVWASAEVVDALF